MGRFVLDVTANLSPASPALWPMSWQHPDKRVWRHRIRLISLVQLPSLVKKLPAQHNRHKQNTLEAYDSPSSSHLATPPNKKSERMQKYRIEWDKVLLPRDPNFCTVCLHFSNCANCTVTEMFCILLYFDTWHCFKLSRVLLKKKIF